MPWIISQEDAKALYDFAKNPNVGPAAGWKPHESIEESMEVIKKIFLPAICFKIIEKKEDRVIGFIGFEPDKRRPDINSKELGYALDEEFWGRGYMLEAVEATLEYMFLEKGMDIISICTNSENQKSQRVIEKAGFVYEGTQRKSAKDYKGYISDTKVYSMLRSEWKKRDIIS